MAAARIEQPALFEFKEDCRPVSERTAAGRYREPSLFDVYAANAGISISDNRLRDSSALSSLVRTRGFNRGQGDERCGNCCQPPQRLIPASAQTGGKTPPRVIDRTSNRFDSKARPFGEALELALRAEPRSTPQRRAAPRANAARRRPRAPSAELADDEPAAGPQHARHLPEHGRRIFDKAENGDRNDGIELPRRKRQVLGGRDLERDRRLLIFRSHAGGVDHLLRGVDTSDLGTPELQCEVSVPAADIEDARTRHIARQLKDQRPFEAIGDDPDIGGPPFGRKPRSQPRKGAISPNVVHRLLPIGHSTSTLSACSGIDPD